MRRSMEHLYTKRRSMERLYIGEIQKDSAARIFIGN